MKKLISLSTIAIYNLLFTNPVFAQSFGIDTVFGPAGLGGGFDTFGELATTILTILVSISGILAIFFIIISGIKFVTAAGDEKQMESAKNTITYAIIGIIVTALAFVILQVVQYFFGADVGTI